MKLNYKRTFFIGLAFLSISAFWQLYDNIVPLILKETFGLGETVTGVVMALDNVLALFLLPIFGALSDRTHTKIGKRTPFILIGTVLAVIFMMLIPISDMQHNFVLFFVGLGIVLIAMGTYRSPAVALMPDLTPKPLRSMANAVINLMGAVGGVFTLLMIKLLVKKEAHPNYIPVYLSVAILMILAVTLLFITIRENKYAKEVQALYPDEEKRPEKKQEKSAAKKADPAKTEKAAPMPKPVKKSLIFILASIMLWFIAYNAVTTAFSRYAVEVWGLKGGDFADCLMVATVAAIISYIPIGNIASKIGRKKTILIGITLMTLSYLCGCLFDTYSPLINVVFAFTGIGWAAINVNSYPMVVEMSRFGDVGKYTGLYYTFSMMAQIITPPLSGLFLEHISYRTLFPYAAVFSVASFCTMLFVKHGDSRPVKKANKLENFDVDD